MALEGLPASAFLKLKVEMLDMCKLCHDIQVSSLLNTTHMLVALIYYINYYNSVATVMSFSVTDLARHHVGWARGSPKRQYKSLRGRYGYKRETENMFLIPRVP